jgi:uncharacterized UBP type Zn finger protein
MADTCEHLEGLELSDFAAARTPEACEECVAEGTTWVALRACKECGHVGCCDSSPGKHATAHYHATGHPVMRAVSGRSTDWSWCYVHESRASLV